MNRWPIAAAFAVAASTFVPSAAHACGCFTPPNPTVPVVQAGERIVFAAWDGQVTAHVQIQYAGDANDFGWLVPLPSLPTLELGTDELFARLSETTDPSYSVDYHYSSYCGSYQGYPASDMGAFFASDLGMGAGGPSPLVVAASIGPYDYAVLKADDKSAMLDWLTANHYFVPVGTDDVVAPYLHPGAYFLALKLHSGQSAGNLQPIVLHYASDYPMIPLTLTSVGAKPHMGIAVWVLGDSRAIPRNYYHAVLDDAALDWTDRGIGESYFDLLTRAVGEAPGRHAFVTEYAGPSAIMKGALDYPGRFGDPTYLATLTDAGDYIRYLAQNGYYFSSALTAILQQYLPLPQGAQGIDPATYYFNYDYYVRTYGPITNAFDPAALTDEIQQRIVQPTRDAAELFSTFPYLTRMYTAISPEDMTRDPTFSFSPFLPEVSQFHRGDKTSYCVDDDHYDALLTTEEGFTLFQRGDVLNPLPSLPASLRIEILREEGDPQVVTDNRAAIVSALAPANQLAMQDPLSGANGSNGCSVRPGTARRGWIECLGMGLGLLALVALVRGRRRR
jgi:MYXO-CTERM domain-containing protein